MKALDLSQIGAKLRQLRESAHLTQAQVAKRLGTRQSAIARLEANQEGNISLETFTRFAAACGFAPLNMELATPAEMQRVQAITPTQNTVALPNTATWSTAARLFLTTVGNGPLPPCAA